VPATATSSPVPPTTTATVTSTTTSTPPPTATSPPPTPTPIVHVVQPGDNLQRLGQQYGVAWQAIAAANGLSETAFLQIGQQLVIPRPG
jgi:LysM repeat protein